MQKKISNQLQSLRRTQEVLTIHSPTMILPDVAKESTITPVDWKAIQQSGPIGWTITASICPSQRDGFTDLLYLYKGIKQESVHGPPSKAKLVMLRMPLSVAPLDHGRSNECYIITPGEPHIGDYLVRRPRGNIHRHPPLLDPRDLLLVDALPPRPYITGIRMTSTWYSPSSICCYALSETPSSYTWTHCLSESVDPTYHISTITSQHNQWPPIIIIITIIIIIIIIIINIITVIIITIIIIIICVYLSIYLCNFFANYLSIHPSTSLSIYLSIYLSNHQTIYPFINPSIYHIYLSDLLERII